jgi:salicylate hydroxylase
LTLRQDATYPTNSFKFLKNTHGENGTHEASNNHNGSSRVSKPLKLNVIVVGAGLGGLATAVALRLHGRQVTVLEQAPALAEASSDQDHASSWCAFHASVD